MDPASLVACNVCGGGVDAQDDVAWTKDGYRIVRCGACGLLFRVSPPQPDELPALYSADYFHSGDHGERGQGYADYVADEEQHRRNARKRLALVERFRPPGRLLDVGCAAGFFLDEARRRGWSVEGVELSTEMARWARDRLALDGVLNTTFLEAPVSGGFDCVTMWDFIEHTLDPSAELRRAHDVLRAGGVLALSTGDAASLVARVTGRRWHLLTPRHHNFFFTTDALVLALERAGFRVLCIRHLGASYSLQHLAHKLRTLVDARALRAAERALPRTRASLAFPVNLRDIVTVVAEAPHP